MIQTGEAENVLVTLSARELALFAPWRERHWRTMGVVAGISELQHQFRRQGLRWTAGGTVNERKQAEEQIRELRRADLVTAAGRTQDRHLRLTTRGRWLACMLCGARDLLDAHQAVKTLLDFAPAGRLISELLPARLKNYKTPEQYEKRLFAFQCIAVPAILENWIAVHSDMLGRVAYSVTHEGKAAAARPAPEPPEDLLEAAAAVDPDALMDLFWTEYGDERDRLMAAQPSHPNAVGPIALSAGLWDEVVGPWNWPKRKRSRKAAK